jgi:hypothetical protein
VKIKSTRNNIKTIRNTDKDFLLKDGIYRTPRAGFEISDTCPINMRNVLFQAIQYNWIMPVAYIKEGDYIWEKLCD